MNRVRWAPEIAVLARCDFIIEAIFERANLKKTKLAEIAELADPAATIASNTTTLPISDLALACRRPERFLGTHFFAPVDRMELLEIVVGEKTAPATIERALLLAKALEKTPMIVRDGPGFFTSRVVAAYLQEALFMVREGISPWMIDNVAQNAGMVLGPLTVADLMSLDLLVDIFESLVQTPTRCGERRQGVHQNPERIYESVTFGKEKRSRHLRVRLPARSASTRSPLTICLHRRPPRPHRTRSNDACS